MAHLISVRSKVLSFIQRIIKRATSFINGAGSIYESTPLAFPSLNADKLKKKLRLLVEAEQRGSKNLPLSGSKSPDDIERSIVGYINEQIRDVSESYEDYQRAFEDRLNRLRATGHAERLEEIAGAAEADFERHVRQSSMGIHTAKKSVEENEKHVDEFKLENNLRRPAVYPENQLLNLSILFFILVAETAMNGKFFAKGSELGLVGGIATAILPSIANMGIAFFLGHFALRLSAGKRSAQKVIGIVLSLVLFVAIFFMNLGVAHYRSAFVMGEQHAATIAMNTIQNSTFSLGDLESWLLLIIGCMCSLLAALKIWLMDDKYPEYGKFSRRRDNKIAEYDYVISHALDDLEARRDDRLEELENVCSEAYIKESSAAVILDNQQRWACRFQDYLDHLQSVGRTLISYYRNKNCEFRSDLPPKYFEQEWSLEYKDINLYTKNDELSIEEFKNDPLQIKKIYGNCIDRINQAYSKSLYAFETIDEIKVKDLKFKKQDLEVENEVS